MIPTKVVCPVPVIAVSGGRVSLAEAFTGAACLSDNKADSGTQQLKLFVAHLL